MGPHFSVNNMLRAECYKQRMEKGLSFLEFNYMIMQSYDFYELFQRCLLYTSSGRPAYRLNQGSLRPQKAFLIRVQNRHQRDFRDVKALSLIHI